MMVDDGYTLETWHILHLGQVCLASLGNQSLPYLTDSISWRSQAILLHFAALARRGRTGRPLHRRRVGGPIVEYLAFDIDHFGEITRRSPRIEPLADVSIPELLEHALGIPKAQLKQTDQNRIARILTSIGFCKYRARVGGHGECIAMANWLSTCNS